MRQIHTPASTTATPAAATHAAAAPAVAAAAPPGIQRLVLVHGPTAKTDAMERTLAVVEAARPDNTFQAQQIEIGAADGSGDLEAVVRPAPDQPPSVYAVDKHGAYSRAMLTILRILQLWIFVRGVAANDARLGGVKFVEAVDEDSCSGAACFLWQLLRVKTKTKDGKLQAPSESVARRLGRQVAVLRFWRNKGFVGLSDELLAACSDVRGALYSDENAIFLEALPLAAIEWMRFLEHGPRSERLRSFRELSRDATGVFEFFKRDTLEQYCRGVVEYVDTVSPSAKPTLPLSMAYRPVSLVLQAPRPFGDGDGGGYGGGGGGGDGGDGEAGEGSRWGSEGEGDSGSGRDDGGRASEERGARGSGSDESGSGSEEQEDAGVEQVACCGLGFVRNPTQNEYVVSAHANGLLLACGLG